MDEPCLSRREQRNDGAKCPSGPPLFSAKSVESKTAGLLCPSSRVLTRLEVVLSARSRTCEFQGMWEDARSRSARHHDFDRSEEARDRLRTGDRFLARRSRCVDRTSGRRGNQTVVGSQDLNRAASAGSWRLGGGRRGRARVRRRLRISGSARETAETNGTTSECRKSHREDSEVPRPYRTEKVNVRKGREDGGKGGRGRRLRLKGEGKSGGHQTTDGREDGRVGRSTSGKNGKGSSVRPPRATAATGWLAVSGRADGQRGCGTARGNGGIPDGGATWVLATCEDGAAGPLSSSRTETRSAAGRAMDRNKGWGARGMMILHWGNGIESERSGKRGQINRRVRYTAKQTHAVPTIQRLNGTKIGDF